MKKLFMLSALAFFAVSCIGQNKPASPRETVKSDNISISYGRPYKKDRVIFGELVKYGEVWRTGANEGTEITFAKDASFAGKPVKAGTYTLFTVPGKSEWTVILNSELGQWGAYKYNKAANVLEATVASKSLDSVVEQLTISTDDKNVTISWDKTSVVIPVSWK